jgi:predicted amidophosphoribosyltransferase
VTTLAAPRTIEFAVRGGMTLEERLSAAWRELGAQGSAACPVCESEMSLADDAGRCHSCGSELR